MAPQECEIPRVGVARREPLQGIDIDLLGRDHVATEHHRLQIEAAVVGQDARDPCEQSAINLLLAPRAVIIRRAEVLEGAQARHGVEPTEALSTHPPCVEELDVEVVAPARRRLRTGQGHADPRAAPIADEVQQRTPSTAQVEYPLTRSDPELFGHVLVLSPLSLLEAQREVAVVLGSAEVGELSHAESKDPIGQRVREIEIAAISHRAR